MRVDKFNAGRFSVWDKTGRRMRKYFYLPSAVTKGMMAMVRARLIATVSSL